jgi:hypothetical protein
MGQRLKDTPFAAGMVVISKRVMKVSSSNPNPANGQHKGDVMKNVFIATVKVMIEAPTAEDADAAISRLLGDEPVLDSSIESLDQAADELVDSIVNETYCEGDFTQPWVMFSPSTEAQCFLGYHSTTYGWVTLDLATR